MGGWGVDLNYQGFGWRVVLSGEGSTGWRIVLFGWRVERSGTIRGLRGGQTVVGRELANGQVHWHQDPPA